MRNFFGTLGFYLLFPLLLLLGIVWWREDSLFIIMNIKSWLTGRNCV